MGVRQRNTETAPLIGTPSSGINSALFGEDEATKPASGPQGLGMVSGVVLPVMLAMQGTIMFLRFGFIVGQAGLLVTWVMLFISFSAATLTVLSLSAVCTNGVMQGGGAYYVISRALGPELGGAMGVLFSISNLVNLALNVMGLGEVVCVVGRAVLRQLRMLTWANGL